MAARTKINAVRATSQSLFLLVSILVYTESIENRAVVAFYNSLHIFPSLNRIGDFVFAEFFFITLLIIAAPLLAGRLYCSWLCPVGFVQDLSAKITKRFNGIPIDKSKRHPISLLILWFCLLSIFIHPAIFGWFDHISHFARLLWVWVSPFTLPFFMALVFLICITIVAAKRPRWFCATLCPSGALYSLLARFARFRVVAVKTCKNCKTCRVHCPAGCIEQNGIDYKLCINCFECVFDCQRRAFAITPFWRHHNITKKPRATSLARRSLITTASGIGAASALFGLKRVLFLPDGAFASTNVPPGGKSIEHFYDRCSFCNLCTSVCPTGVLVPSGPAQGMLTLGKPRLDFYTSYCLYECNACTAVCPTGALTYTPIATKKLIKIGSAKLNKETCIPFASKQDCAACAEHCPTGGVTTEKRGDIRFPVINQEFCIGCGSCQHICPIEPIAAIVVEGERVHGVAYDPTESPPPRDGNTPPDKGDPADFPF